MWGNIFGFGLGELLGYGAKGIARAGSSALQGIGNAADRLGQALHPGLALPGGGRWFGGFGAHSDSGARVYMSADNSGRSLPRQMGLDEATGGDDFARIPDRRGAPRVGSRTGNTGDNAALLNASMQTNQVPRPVSNETIHAHHIVPSTHARAYNARVKLNQVSIDINSHYNGVYLPQLLHAGLHTHAYIDKVNELLRDVTTSDQAIQVLDSIRQSIRSGNFP